MISKYGIFCKVVESGSFTRVAEQLGYSQSAVSQTVKSLEQELGTVLIDRRRDGMVLTSDGLRVYPAVIKKHLDAEMPFMVTENIMMYCVTHKGGDRQELHEHIRQHSVAAGINIKQNGAENDLYDRILADPIFGLSKEELEFIVSEGRITGLAQKQTEDFLADYVQPVLAKYGAELGAEATVNV